MYKRQGPTGGRPEEKLLSGAKRGRYHYEIGAFNMYLRVLTPEELNRVYETDLTEAFPPAELIPL